MYQQSQGSAATAVYQYLCVTGTASGNTPTPTWTPIGGGGGTNTPSFTPTGSITPTPTPSPTFTAVPTSTQTPIPTLPPTPAVGACYTPVGGNTSTLMGGVSTGPVYCFNNNCGSAHTASCNYLTSDTSVFGMSLGEVRNIADNYGNSTGPVNLVIPGNWQLSYFSGNLTYGPTQANYPTLQGLGILVVDGNLTLQQGSGTINSSNWGGVIFCTGNVSVGAGCEINGALIMGYKAATSSSTTGTLTLTGDSSNSLYAQITYSPALVNAAANLVAQYREDVSERKQVFAVPGL